MKACRAFIVLLLVGVAGAQAQGHAADGRRPAILAPDEGDHLGSHYIKADPATSSMRFGAELQKVGGRQGIPIHRHDQEDETLFIHSGSGVGIVGSERRNIGARTTLYILQGTWHAVESRGSSMELPWVVSPPHFANNLRETGATLSRGGAPSSGELKAIGRKHGFRDAQEYFLPRLAMIAATLAFAGLVVALASSAHRLRSVTSYALGAILATSVTLVAIGGGSLTPIVLVVSAFIIAATVAVGALGGVGARALANRLGARPR